MRAFIKTVGCNVAEEIVGEAPCLRESVHTLVNLHVNVSVVAREWCEVVFIYDSGGEIFCCYSRIFGPFQWGVQVKAADVKDCEDGFGR